MTNKHFSIAEDVPFVRPAEPCERQKQVETPGRTLKMSNVKHNKGHLEEKKPKKLKGSQNSKTADTRKQW